MDLSERMAALEAEAASLRLLAGASASAPATVLLIGSGGREHAIALSLAKSDRVARVVVSPGNGGTASAGGKISNLAGGLDIKDHGAVVACAKGEGAAMVVVGPEDPLAAGLADACAAAGLPCFGPSKAAAQLEASKAFSKQFMAKYGLPTAQFAAFTDQAAALAYAEKATFRVVVKCSGLAAGKGVLLPETKEETYAAIKEVMGGSFGSAGSEVVLEEYMEGQEVSLLAFCDGAVAVGMPGAQDHKRVNDGDLGLNTGGMGAYAPAPVLTPALRKEAMRVCQATVNAMASEGTPYKGVLYAGLMIGAPNPSNPKAPRVRLVEFNCRFGDPETQVVLPLLQSDLFDVMAACVLGTLATTRVDWAPPGTFAATVVAAAGGYPETYAKGNPITLTPPPSGSLLAQSSTVYHAGTKVDSSGQLVTSGGRVLSVTGTGATLATALHHAYTALDHGVAFEGLHRRSDIGWRAAAPHRPVVVGVLGSTNGTDFQFLLEASAKGQLPGVEFCVVLSNKADAGILAKGTAAGVPSLHVPCAKTTARDEYDAAVTAALTGAGAELVLCIGWMRILSPSFCQRWAGRCLNVHPSLLPAFAGGMDGDVHAAVLAAGVKTTGCTVHWVTEEVDGGAHAVQKECPVVDGDTPETLKAKVQALEGAALSEAIMSFKAGQVGNTLDRQPRVTTGGKSGGLVVSYKDAGVDIDLGNALVERIKPACKATRRPGCDADLGGFGGLFDLSAAGFGAEVGGTSAPPGGSDSGDVVLVGATDGVGTKLKVAFDCVDHRGVGIDLVAMCVNDLIVCGAEPLFFLDYFATGHLSLDTTATVVESIANGCAQAKCGLVGGETAEMPSMYADGEYDLGGFAVGAVRKRDLLPNTWQPGMQVASGDVLLALASSGVHSNGFSLVRKLVNMSGLKWDDPAPFATTPQGLTLGEALLTPTKIYVAALMPLLKRSGLVKALAHITGGGLPENIPRVLPSDLAAEVNLDSLSPLPPVFQWLQQASNLSPYELTKTFNCGVGMVVVVSAELAEEATSTLAANGETARMIGRLIPRASEDAPQVTLLGELK